MLNSTENSYIALPVTVIFHRKYFIAKLNCFITLTCNCFTDHLRLVWKLKSKLLNKLTKFFKKSKCQENIRDSTEFLFVWLMRKIIFIENFFLTNHFTLICKIWFVNELLLKLGYEKWVFSAFGVGWQNNIPCRPWSNVIYIWYFSMNFIDRFKIKINSILSKIK